MARTPLFSRLPEIWKILDQVENVVEQKGVLQRYLEVWDSAIDASQSAATSVLDTRDINTIPDRYLRLIGELVGHRWREYRSYQWNRQRIRESIAKYSYKGTYIAISDLAYEHRSPFCEVIDMASTVAVWSRQGTMDEDNCYFFDSDFHHPGVFLLKLAETVDFEHFLEDFEYIKPAGTKWYFYICPNCVPVSVTATSTSELKVLMELTPRGDIPVFDECFHDGIIPRESLLVPHVITLDDKSITLDQEDILIDGTSDTYI